MLHGIVCRSAFCASLILSVSGLFASNDTLGLNLFRSHAGTIENIQKKINESFLNHIQNLQTSHGNVVIKGMDTLELLKAQTLSDGSRRIFNPKRQPTEQEFNAIVQAVAHTMSRFSGNFLWENYIFNNIGDAAQRYGKHAAAYQRHLACIYMMGSYIQKRMMGADGSVIKTGLQNNARLKRFANKEKILNFLNRVEKSIADQGIQFKNADHKNITILGREDELPGDYLRAIDAQNIIMPEQTLRAEFSPQTGGVDYLDTPQTYHEMNENEKRQRTFVALIPRYLDDPAIEGFYYRSKPLRYIFNITDNANQRYLVGYSHGRDSLGYDDRGSIVFLSSAPQGISENAKVHAQNIQDFLNNHRRIAYPLQKLKLRDGQGDIHDGWNAVESEMKNAHNQVGTPPLILEGVTPPGYIDAGIFENKRMIRVGEDGRLDFKISDAEIANTFDMPLLKEAKDNETQAFNTLKQLMEQMGLGNRLFDVINEIKTWEPELSFDFDGSGPLGQAIATLMESRSLRQGDRNKLTAPMAQYYTMHNNLKDARKVAVDSLESFISENNGKARKIQFTPITYDGHSADYGQDPIQEQGKETVSISYFTSPHALKTYAHVVADKQSWENSEFYMIQVNPQYYEGWQRNYNLAISDQDYTNILYTYFYTPRVLYRFDKNTNRLYRLSEGVLGIDMSLQVDALMRHLEKKHHLNDGDVTEHNLDEALKGHT